MSFRFELEQWHTACIAYDNKQYEPALKMFINIADSSKIHFNIGLIFAAANEHDRAIASYTRAIELDPYMAVARFQRGVSYFLKEDMASAMENFNQTYEHLRGNKIINYQQLGLVFLLYSCEVLFNRGICQLYMGKMDAGLTDLYYAQKAGVTAEHAIIDQAVRDQGKGYSLFSIPPGVLFRPQESKLRQLNEGMFSTAVEQITPKKQFTRNNSILLKQKPISKFVTKSSQSSPTSSTRFFSRNESNSHPPLDTLASMSNAKYSRSADSGFESFTEERYSVSPPIKTLSRLAYEQSPKEEDEGYGDFDKELEEVYGSFDPYSLNEEKDWIKQRWGSQEELQLSTSTSTSRNTSTSGKLKIKVHYKDTRILLVSNKISFEELKMRIQEKFNTPNSILLQYKDEENELVLLIDNDDLQIARQVCRRVSTKNDLEKIELWCVDK